MTQLPLSETPTSLQVDNASGKILVTTVASTPGEATPAGSDTAASSGHVAVFDAGTKKLEQLRGVDVAPRLAVPDPAGGRTLLDRRHPKSPPTARKPATTGTYARL